MTKHFIDKFTIKHWRQGYSLEVGVMRPVNAPRYRLTKADFDRQEYTAKINMKLAKKWFKDLNEIQEYLEKLNKGNK